ncbi:MAG: hypothetical protein Q9170_002178 [Blastenia crenularia]
MGIVISFVRVRDEGEVLYRSDKGRKGNWHRRIITRAPSPIVPSQSSTPHTKSYSRPHLSAPIITIIIALSCCFLGVTILLLNRYYRRYRCREHAKKTARAILEPLTEDIALAEREQKDEASKRKHKSNERDQGKMVSNGNGLEMTEEQWIEAARVGK